MVSCRVPSMNNLFYVLCFKFRRECYLLVNKKATIFWGKSPFVLMFRTLRSLEYVRKELRHGCFAYQ